MFSLDEAKNKNLPYGEIVEGERSRSKYKVLSENPYIVEVIKIQEISRTLGKIGTAWIMKNSEWKKFDEDIIDIQKMFFELNSLIELYIEIILLYAFVCLVGIILFPNKTKRKSPQEQFLISN